MNCGIALSRFPTHILESTLVPAFGLPELYAAVHVACVLRKFSRWKHFSIVWLANYIIWAESRVRLSPVDEIAKISKQADDRETKRRNIARQLFDETVIGGTFFLSSFLDSVN